MKRLIWFLLPFLFIFFLYLHNLSSDVYGGDVGDLVTAGFVMGVPHPPGYPFFTLLVFLLSKIPISATVAYKAGLISVVSSMLALIIYFFYVKKITKNIIISYLSVLILAFSYLFWFYSEIAEVFALNNLFVIALLILALSFYKTKKIILLYPLSFLMGLSLTNQQTIILIFPSIILLVLAHYKIFIRQKFLLLKSFIFFALGLLPYLYVPFAAKHNPVINWDNAVTLKNFLHLVLRQGYGTFSPGSFTPALPEERVLILKEFITVSISSITFPVVLICILGVIYLIYKKQFIVLTSLLLSYILIGPFFSIYAGFPLVNAFVIGVAERFYIASTIIFMFLFPFGALAIFEFFKSVFSKKIYAYVLLSVFFIIPVLLFKYNFERTNLSKSTIGSDFGRDLISFMPKNSVFFVNGDTAVFNTWYMHYVNGLRPDLIIVRMGDFQTNSFTKPYIDNYKKQKVNENEYEWVSKEIMKNHRVFFNNKSQLNDKKLSFIQYGLISELVQKAPGADEYKIEISKIWSQIEIPIQSELPIYERNLTASHIVSNYADALSLTANDLYYKYNDKDTAKKYLELSLKTDARIARTYASYALLLSSGFKQCTSAESYTKKAIDLNPLAMEYQVILYDIYKECFQSDKKVEQFKKNFKVIYGRDFDLKNP